MKSESSPHSLLTKIHTLLSDKGHCQSPRVGATGREPRVGNAGAAFQTGGSFKVTGEGNREAVGSRVRGGCRGPEEKWDYLNNLEDKPLHCDGGDAWIFFPFDFETPALQPFKSSFLSCLYCCPLLHSGFNRDLGNTFLISVGALWSPTATAGTNPVLSSPL